MPANIRVLIIVLALAAVSILLARQLLVPAVSKADFKRYMTLWCAITVTLFITGNFWIYLAIATIFILFFTSSEPVKPAIYALLFTAVPTSLVAIPGFGIVNTLIGINHQSLLAIIVLLPALIVGARRSETYLNNLRSFDVIVISYIAILVGLQIRDTEFTHVLRVSVATTLNILLPYFAFSRLLTTHDAIRKCFFALLCSVLILSLIGAFESIKTWLLYHPEHIGWDTPNSDLTYKTRGALLRATTSAQNPISFGFVCMVGLGALLAIRPQHSKQFYWWLAIGVVLIGLGSSLSRGPWLGAVLLWLWYLYSGSRLALVGVSSVAGIFLLIITQFSQTPFSFLPFGAGPDAGTISYRQRLLTNAWSVIERNFWFGSANYHETQEMRDLIQGEGIIDFVNTYVAVALETGVVGLSLFLAFFVWITISVERCLRQLPKDDVAGRQLGRALFSTLVAIILVIFTTSSVTLIPYVYWIVAGMGVAYVRTVRKSPNTVGGAIETTNRRRIGTGNRATGRPTAARRVQARPNSSR